MSLKLYYHPLSSYCWKVLIALYENDTPFQPCVVNLMDPEERAAFLQLWPIGKFPVVRDEARDALVPESSIIIEYLDRHYPGRSRLVPEDDDLARQTRMRDRFFDLHVHTPMQKIVGDRLRPADKKDPHGVEEARRLLRTALGIVDEAIATKKWAMGDAFSMADCSAAPAIFYADKVMALQEGHKNVSAYLGRLRERPSFARVLAEAQPYFKMFPV